MSQRLRGRGRLRPRPGTGCYALRQLNGAYCPLFLPPVSFQLTPRASTWLFIACARAMRSDAGCPVFDSCSGSVAAGLSPIAACADMSSRLEAVTDHLTPSSWNLIGAD